MDFGDGAFEHVATGGVDTGRPVWRPTFPTTYLYLLNACLPWLGHFPIPFSMPGGTLRRLGANSFLAGRHVVVCRQDHPAVIWPIVRDESLTLTYVIDDDLWALEEDPSLPVDYRDRMIALREGQHRALVERARTVVVCSNHLAERYRDIAQATQILDPYWIEPMAGDRHFGAFEKNRMIDIAYLGSVTHGADRAFVFDVMARLLESHPRIRFTLVSAKPLGNALDRHARVRRLRPLPWFLYRRFMRFRRYHLALYPMLDTPFNQGRSLNKLIEHAIVGAPGIYSRGWEYADRVVDGKTGLLAENSVDAWVAAVESALADPRRLRAMQGAAREAASRLNNPAPQRAFWSADFELKL